MSQTPQAQSSTATATTPITTPPASKGLGDSQFANTVVNPIGITRVDTPPPTASSAETPAQAEADPALEKKVKGMTFPQCPRFENDLLPVLQKKFGDDFKYTKQLAEVLENAEISHRIKKKRKGSMEITDIALGDGSKISFIPEYQGSSEFIGKSGLGKFTSETAKAAIALAVSKGWTKVAVLGATEYKDMMWLEAQRQGLEVVKYRPDPKSQVWEILKAEDEEKYRNALAGKPNKASQKQEAEEDPAKRQDAGVKNVQSQTAAAEPEKPKTTEAPSTPAEKGIGSSKIAITQESKPSRAPQKDTFEDFLDKKIAAATSNEEKRGLNELGEALASGKLKMDAAQKAVFMGKLESPLFSDTGKAIGGYNNAIADVQNIAKAQGSSVTFPKVPEKDAPATTPSIIIPTGYKSRGANGP